MAAGDALIFKGVGQAGPFPEPYYCLCGITVKHKITSLIQYHNPVKHLVDV